MLIITLLNNIMKHTCAQLITIGFRKSPQITHNVKVIAFDTGVTKITATLITLGIIGEVSGSCIESCPEMKVEV